ncbi:hypothetical protein [Bacillus sp. 1NLA3E]|uniref:hypothetical protein n=1 Tax=Bacillus sp. 1NLA3E TaxID=666686 RepID=UPI000247F47A|nr:hypothetical protein [Bacillus sp. 1NLA3E]AGK55283.1 hypothetical protein B1NLA3E_17695 [Bacillus sp. 1NLA3E]
MRKTAFYISLLMCLLMTLPNDSSAESNVDTNSPILSMEELSIQLMPEYSYHPMDKKKDHPPLLVGLHASLMNKSAQPQRGQIEIPLPVKSKDFRIGFVADYNRDGSKMNEIEYDINKDRGTISWTTSEDVQPGEFYKFVVEYYTNDIKVNQKKNTLDYQFKSFANIGLVRILFLEPLKTNSFKLTPAAESHQENGYGMNMFMYQIQGMIPDQTKKFHLEYKRSDSKTTMDIMAEMGDKTAKQGQVKKNKTLSMGVMVGGVGGISGVVAILVLLFLKRKAKKKKKETSLPDIDLGQTDLETKKKRLRGMLLEGNISEEEYQELLRKLVE